MASEVVQLLGRGQPLAERDELDRIHEREPVAADGERDVLLPTSRCETVERAGCSKRGERGELRRVLRLRDRVVEDRQPDVVGVRETGEVRETVVVQRVRRDAA